MLPEKEESCSSLWTVGTYLKTLLGFSSCIFGKTVRQFLLGHWSEATKLACQEETCEHTISWTTLMGSSFCQYNAVANVETSLRRLRKKSIEATNAKGMAGMVNSEEPRNKLENLGFIELLHRACRSGLRLQLCDLRHLLKSILDSTCSTLPTAQATAQVLSYNFIPQASKLKIRSLQKYIYTPKWGHYCRWGITFNHSGLAGGTWARGTFQCLINPPSPH